MSLHNKMSYLSPNTYCELFTCPYGMFHFILNGENIFNIKQILLELCDILFANHDNLGFTKNTLKTRFYFKY